MSHAKVAVSIHRGSDGPDRARVAPRSWIPYSDDAVSYVAAAVALVALAVYVRTMMPSTFFWDTGEAQTVPATLSIFHPTGFPVRDARLAWSQLPFGEVAWRMNLLSGVCVALASGLVVLITGHLIEEATACCARAPASAGFVRLRGRAVGERDPRRRARAERPVRRPHRLAAADVGRRAVRSRRAASAGWSPRPWPSASASVPTRWSG